MPTVTAEDGVEVRFQESGNGRPLLVVHGGLEDGWSWRKVSDQLAGRFKVAVVHRRTYRLDLAAPEPSRAYAAEVQDLVRVAASLGEPPILVGHSSGAVVTLEALAQAPGAFAGGAVYEPPLIVDEPLATPDVRERAHAAIRAGRNGRALSLFLGEVVKAPRWMARLAGPLVARTKRYGPFIPRQLFEVDVIDALGPRLPAYSSISVPVLLIGGTKSPPHLAGRLDALEKVLPSSERVLIPRQGHSAQTGAPAVFAEHLGAFADRVFAERPTPPRTP